MPAILSGTYRCAVQGRLYTYDVLWDAPVGEIIRWEARVSHDRRLTTINGSVSAAGDDESQRVRASVHEGIEAYSRAQVHAKPDR